MLDELRLNARYGDLGPVWGIWSLALTYQTGGARVVTLDALNSGIH